MTEYLSCAETAKLVRAALKTQFPGTKFSVRSDTYSGGASIDVRWTDGPTETDVKATCDLYEGATFDGMRDLKEYHSSILVGPEGEIRDVHFGADFIFEHRAYSAEFLASLEILVEPNGLTRGNQQCGQCGDWMPAGDCYVAHGDGTGRDFVCSPQCGAKRLARITDARSVSV